MDLGGFLASAGTAILGYIIGRWQQRDAIKHLQDTRSVTHEDTKERVAITGTFLELSDKHQKPVEEIISLIKRVEKLQKGGDTDDVDIVIRQLGGLMNVILFNLHETAEYLAIFGERDEDDLRIRFAYLSKLIEGKKHLAFIREANLPVTFAKESADYFDEVATDAVWGDLQKLAAIPPMREICEPMMPGLANAVATIKAANSPQASQPGITSVQS